MATLQTIRTRAGVLVAVVIGLALFAFILGDLFQSGSSLFRRGQMEIGKIDGESVQYPEFQKKIEELGEIYRLNGGKSQLDEETWVQVREQTWQTYVRDKVMGDIYKKTGLGVTSEELFDMMQGANPHPIIQQIFTNPETGQFDRSGVVNFLKNLETGVTPEQRSYWLYLEKQIVGEKLLSKYNTLVNKSLYVTGAEAQRNLELKNRQVDIEYIGLSSTIIPDSMVKASSEELKKYYADHSTEYQDEKTRSIEYIVWNVKPSAADFSASEKWINEIRKDFAGAADNVQFVNSNSDVGFEDTWYKPDAVPGQLASWIAGGAVLNDVFGPYFENNSYKLAKLHAVEMLPDSVEARHILLAVNSAAEAASARALADSLKKVIDQGGDFAALARQYSTDTGSAMNGGDLGWFGRGRMVKPFEEAAFGNQLNEVQIATSQFGIHIVQTTRISPRNKQLQLAILERTVTPSTRTYQDTYAQASKFANENTSKEAFDKAAEEGKLAKNMVVLRETDQQLGDFQYPRVLIRAAFEAKPGTVIKNTDGSPIFELGDNFVIATLINATEKGVSPFENVKSRVELAVLKEKKLKLLAERLAKAAEGKSDMAAMATAAGSQLKTAASINFNSVTLPDFGMEPAVIGAAIAIKAGEVSSPVTGNNAVFLLKVVSEQNLADTNVDAEKERLMQAFGYRVSSQAYDALQKAVTIDDKRAKFY